MSKLKDLMLDVQSDLEAILSNKPHLTRNQAVATVSVMRELAKREFVHTELLNKCTTLQCRVVIRIFTKIFLLNLLNHHIHQSYIKSYFTKQLIIGGCYGK